MYVFLSVVLNLVVERKSESQLAQVNMWQEKAERTWRSRFGGR